MLTRAHNGGARRQSSFPRLSHTSSGTQRQPERRGQHSLGSRPYPLAALRAHGERQAQWRIERTGVSDAKKRASYPLAKRAGARCAF